MSLLRGRPQPSARDPWAFKEKRRSRPVTGGRLAIAPTVVEEDEGVGILAHTGDLRVLVVQLLGADGVHVGVVASVPCAVRGAPHRRRVVTRGQLLARVADDAAEAVRAHGQAQRRRDRHGSPQLDRPEVALGVGDVQEAVQRDDEHLPGAGEQPRALRQPAPLVVPEAFLGEHLTIAALVVLEDLGADGLPEEVQQRHGHELLREAARGVELRGGADERQAQRDLGPAVRLHRVRALQALPQRVRRDAEDALHHALRRHPLGVPAQQLREAVVEGLQDAAEELVGVLLLA
eukprot:CAMPEP_0176286844 /NCGR_PEP_ID=MMETSP0121_2-20121125/53120_1 /TAXON_ID=160619 /ORGANISM="Kryptoperidinium foliaceum, Strain CCMP 1326" /LENGTH=290 /DNA_ID=CAMNT_0017627423 /DNA_START=317 /DNA_END=1186 /DNA_ORIENTATION=+